MRNMISTSEMGLGDTVIRKYNDGRYMDWGFSLVKEIKDKEVTLFRPYGSHADFEYTGGVVCYIGIEEYKLPVDSFECFELIHKGNVK